MLKLQYFDHLMQSPLFGKDLDVGKDWGQEKKGTTEGEMAGWHHWLNGHEFEQVPGDGEGQGSLACCSSGGHKWLSKTKQSIREWIFPTSAVLHWGGTIGVFVSFVGHWIQATLITLAKAAFGTWGELWRRWQLEAVWWIHPLQLS